MMYTLEVFHLPQRKFDAGVLESCCSPVEDLGIFLMPTSVVSQFLLSNSKVPFL
ncbi:hypothetical protein HanIR_Chr11g0518701 [Helianthus annuus]|nr:hypothetical protein HanIR_Chr11g0518701 [Helianthus annuus]